MAVRKPAGIHVHPTLFDAGETSLLPLLEEALGQKIYPVHRLDRPTSGVLIFAKDRAMASFLGTAFRERRVEKVYHLVVRGWMPESVAASPVKRDRKDPRLLDAETSFVGLEFYEPPWPRREFDTFRFSLVEARPQTGRHHQIRQHCDQLRHPILGDTVWGDTNLNAWFQKQTREAQQPWVGLQLWCRKMVIPHPDQAMPLVIESPLSSEEQSLLDWYRRYQVTVSEKA